MNGPEDGDYAHLKFALRFLSNLCVLVFYFDDTRIGMKCSVFWLLILLHMGDPWGEKPLN